MRANNCFHVIIMLILEFLLLNNKLEQFRVVQSLESTLPITEENTKLWDRRLSSQFMLQTENKFSSLSFANGTGLSRLVIPPPGIAQTEMITQHPMGAYEFNNINMFPNYEPPKPDTPPSKDVPYWIDPIWTNNNHTKQPNNNLLNIKLPELKTFNVLPMVLSPYTLSKNENMRQQTFNFDNHDRKIA